MSLEHENSEDLLNYVVTGIIGTGSFGTCYKVKDKTTNKYYVWKAVDYGSMSLHEKELLVTEVNLMGTLRHPHIVQYYGRIIHKSSGTLYIKMEWCEGGDLDTLINKCKLKNLIISEKFIWKVLYQTAKALEACHSLLNQVTVLHRDIKPANIFLDKYYNVKLGDFGLAKILQNNINFSSTLVGTLYYMSPEQIHGQRYNKKTDVWSLGCLIYELCRLNQPFNGTNLEELRENITKNRLSRIPSMYSEYLDKMVKLLLSSNHEFRPSVEMIVHHPTVVCNYDPKATPFQPENTHLGCGDSVYQITTERHRVHKLAQVTGDIDGIIRRIESLSTNTLNLSIDSDPLAITENVYNRKLMSRLKFLREKESVLNAKEDNLRTKEDLLKSKESTLEFKRKLIEKREREVAALQQNTIKNKLNRQRMKSADRIKVKRASMYNSDLDSTTCSADPGDASILPTAVKLDPMKIIRPTCFGRDTIKKSVGILQTECDADKLKANLKNSENAQSRQPLTYLQNYVSATTTAKNKNGILIKKYQNFIYKR